MTLYVDSNPGPTRGRGVICMAGQSNTGQRGHVSALTGSDITAYGVSIPAVRYCQRNYDGVLDSTLAYDFDWEDLQGTGAEPNGTGNITMGLEKALGANLTPGKFAIAKFLHSATTSQQWIDHGWAPIGAAYLLGQIQELSTLLGENCYPAAMVWVQGEDERASTVAGWGANMDQVEAAFQLGLGRLQLPWIVVETQDYDGSTDTGIRAAQIAWTGARATRHLIVTDSYPYENPPHWESPSYCRIGELVATYLNAHL